MPLFMDVHDHVDGLTPEAIAHAHELDLETQNKYGVHYLHYWFDSNSGKVFCLVKAPNKEAAMQVHKDAHGLIADHIYEVKQGAWARLTGRGAQAARLDAAAEPVEKRGFESDSRTAAPDDAGCGGSLRLRSDGD